MALAVRFWFVRLYGPVVEGDAITYLRIGRLLATGRLDEYDGAAPPVYGAFLELLGESPTLVQAVQSLLGVAISLLVAWLVWRPTRSTALAVAAGLTHALAMDSLCFEAFLVAETLSTALLVGAMVLLTMALERPRPAPWLVFGMSLVLSLGGLTKPLLLTLFPVAWAALVWRWRSERTGRAIVVTSLAGALPIVVLVGGWSVYNGRTHGVWGPSTMTGYRMSQHVGSVMQDAPDRYRVIRDIFVAHRDRSVAETGSATNTIWAAIPEMERATGLPYGRLSLEVNEMSWAVAQRHPDVLVRSVASAWTGFWSRPMYYKPAHAHTVSARAALMSVARAERPLGWALNLGLLLLAPLWLFLTRLRRKIPPAPAGLFLAVVLAGSIAQALAERSDNGRFAVPLLPLIVVTAVLAVWSMWNRA
ncbi:MAG: hypothetical protein ACHQ52_07410 [Candidatus Eisenbacteria bacterium]